jgi:hypothetical protein
MPSPLPPAPPPATSAPFDPVTVASVTQLTVATRAAVASTAALAAAARDTPSRTSQLRATAAVGASFASTAVSLAALDTHILSTAPSPSSPIAPAAPTAATADALVALLRGRSIHAVSDVIALMHAIDAALPASDGLKAFNLLYLMVTESVDTKATWEDPSWILGLDMIFANLYFDGVERSLTAPDTAPAAWRTLMDRRTEPGIAPVQFALAGMNAQINRDLAVAVARTWAAMGPADHGRTTPAYHDYLGVNAVLDAVEPQAMAQLATGLFKLVDTVCAPVDGWVAMKIVHAARDLAWTHAVNLAGLGVDTDAARAYVDALDSIAADVSCAALVTVP